MSTRSAVAGIYRAGAWLFTAFALLGVVLLFRARWAKPIDFDVTGFMWLLQNFPNLTLLVGTLFTASVAIYCWIRARQFT